MRRRAALLAILLSGCGILGLEDERDREIDRLERNLLRWSERAPERYSFQLQRLCYCVPETTRSVRIEVEDGVVVSRSYEADGTAVPQEWEELFPAMEGVFAIVREALGREGSVVEVTYDVVLGFPRVAAIDYIVNAIDDELELRVQNVTIP
jgi:hypothetical protein